jgi:hypothetical protein
VSTAALRSQLNRLKRDLPQVYPGDGCRCPRKTIGLIVDAGPDGKPLPYDEADVAPCATCGGVGLVMVITEEVIEPGDAGAPSAAGGEARCP